MSNSNVMRKHTKEKDFTMIDNGIFKDKKISLKAKGLLTMMLSLPDDWRFSESGLSQLSTDGRASIRSALQELEDNGYLYREQIHRENTGKFGGMIYNIFEVKQTVYDLPTSDKPTSDKPTSDNQHNKELIDKRLNNKVLINESIGQIENMFNEFWELYPRKVAKDKTKDIFIKLKPNEEQFNLIKTTLEKYKLTEQWQDKTYIPHPSTWLNQKRYEDEVILPKGSVLPEWFDKDQEATISKQEQNQLEQMIKEMSN